MLGVLIAIPVLGVGFFHDDLMHRLMLEDGVPGFHVAPHALYDFTGRPPGITRALIDHGHLPWFTDPALTMRFFRPLSSLLLALDARLFGRDPFYPHVLSIAWLLVLLSAVSAILVRALRPTSATVAVAIYALAGAHAMTTGFLAARHALLGAALGAICVWAHTSWRETGDRWRAPIAPIALVLGLLASETALGAVVFVLLYELLVPRNTIFNRAMAATPALFLGLVHLATYVTSGYGAHRSGAHLAPFDDPEAFAEATLSRGPALLGELYGALPVALWSFAEPLRPALAIYGLALFGLCVALVYRARVGLRELELRRLVWLSSASVLSLLPMVGGFPGGRLLPLAMIGSAAVVGTAIVQTWVRARKRPAWRRSGLRLAIVGLVILHLGFAPLVRVGLAYQLSALAEAERRLAADADLEACPDGARAYVLTGADPVISLYASSAIAFYAPERVARVDRWRVLSMAPNPQTLARLDARTFELAIEEPRVVSLFEHVYRNTPMQVGDDVEVEELEARVEAVEAGFPTRVRFTVEDGLGRVCFLRWDGARLVATRPPAVGEREAIDHEPGPSGL